MAKENEFLLNSNFSLVDIDSFFCTFLLFQIFTVYNESKLPHPLMVQLVDKGGNPCHEADVRILLGKDTGVKVRFC